MPADRVNVVVVGGGIIGCCTAYFLARAGARVTLLERGSLCSEASSAAAGLAGVSNRDGLLLSLAQESLRLLDQAGQELGTDFGLRRRGSLMLLRTEEELREQQAFVEKQRGRGVDIRLLDRETALEMEPAASPEILGAVYSPLDCSISPYAATLAFGQAARRLGADLRPGVEVTALKAEGFGRARGHVQRVRAALTREGEVAGDLVVVAAGAWSPSLTRTIGLDLPIEPSRGQIVVTEPLPSLTRAVVKDTGHIYLCPTERGNYVIGSMTEKVGFNKQLTAHRLRDYVSEGAALVPALAGARVLRAWAGLRPLSPDNTALLGPVEGYEGLVLATGHSRLGILLSAVTSKIVADLITTGRADFPLESFNPLRFRPAA